MISERLKELRIRQGLTQVELARKIGITKDLYNKYERTDIRPPYETICKLADVLSTTTDYILERTNNPTPVYKKDSPEDVLSFADRLKKYRKAAGLTQRDMAKKLFISQQAYAKYELGSSSPNPDMLADIANILNVSANLLLNDESVKADHTDIHQNIITENSKANSPISHLNTIMDRVTKMRLKAGLSRQELTEKSGVSFDIISNLEDGKGGISGDNVLMLAKALNTSFDYLMGLSEDSTPPKKSLLAQLADNPPDSQPVAYIFGSNGGRKIITDKNKIDAINAFAELLDKNDSE
ncbi:MAG: helix-turn-helix domain-containing protein [Christensenellaceae bacterium]|nr:helix-turn-helix domain-containing protein [Christensenellaceae bacterium]DAS00364.1 MAG TPA: repressor protein [Bacteriophage sp.]